MERLTTNDDANSNYLAMMNFAYCENGRVCLRYADSEDDIDLCEYVSRMAQHKCCRCTAEEIMDGACAECDCELAVLYISAVQAAELRDRLMIYEDTGLTPEQIVKLQEQNVILKKMLRVAAEDANGLFKACDAEYNKHNDISEPENCKFCKGYSDSECKLNDECKWRYAEEVEEVLQK